MSNLRKKSLTLSDGTTISYWEYHEDAPTTMVMIHGFSGSHEGFQYLVPLLPEIHLIVPDLPGFGVSDLPPRDDWSIDGLAQLANELVELLQLDTPPLILGHSMGGLVVSSMIYQQPQLYDDRAILISPVPTSVRIADPRRVGMILGALQYRIGRKTGRAGDRLVRSRTISRILTRTMLHTNDPIRRRAIYQHHFRNLDFISDFEFYEKILTDTNRLGSVHYADALRSKSVLLLAGDKDTITPLREMKKFATAITPRKFVIIPGVGHLIHYEKSPEAAEAIRVFLKQ